MLNRNKIFKTVRDTTDTLNVSTGRKMDNFYTELLTYKDMVQTKYDKIKGILNNLKYHHNKIQNLNKNYSNAIYGGGKTDLSKLMKDIDIVIENIDILIGTDGIISESKFDKLIKKKTNEIKESLDLGEWKENYKLKKDQVTEKHKVFFDTASKELSEIKKEFDENRTYINNLVETIKKFEDSVNQYILDRKLSKDFRQIIKQGIRDLSKLIDDDSKKDFEKFNTYRNNITNGLAYAKEEEALVLKLEKDPNSSDDLRILQQFKNDKNNIQFIFNSETTGYLKIGSKKIEFDYNYKEGDNTYNTYKKLNFQNNDILKHIYVNVKKTGDTFSPSKDYFLDFEILQNIYEQKELKSYVSDIYNKLQGYAKKEEDRIKEKLTDILNILVDNKFFSNYLLKSIATATTGTAGTAPVFNNINDLKKQEIFKELNSDNTIIPQLKAELDKLKKTKIEGGVLEEETAKVEKLKSSVNKTLEIFKKIRKQIEEDYDKEYNLSNQPQNPNESNITNTIKSAQTMLGLNEEEDESKFTNSIISSILENYEKERLSVNTIEDKIKLDTKFVDILDNLELNLSDIFKVNFEDKLAFIFFILILHIVVYSIVESLIMNDYLTDIVYIMAVYVGVYVAIMFILILILNKYVNYRMKSVLNYLNTDFNMQLITMHLFIVFMFYIIVLILSQHIDIFKAEDEDDKLQVLYRIEVISSIIFIFSGVFVMIL
tara:strand:- start:3206 stop:5347 length:2142 start_codon:yes stop_codon:yes gene_type:complete